VYQAPYAVNDNGQYNWRVRSTMLAEGDYVVRIQKVNKTDIVDYCETTFSIVIPFAITFPNGGETLSKGQTYTIVWDPRASGVDKVKLSLHKGSGRTWYKNIAVETDNSVGSFTWTVPTSWDEGTEYTIRIRNTDYTSSYDFSDTLFTIA
jgi:hypothetical protein